MGQNVETERRAEAIAEGTIADRGSITARPLFHIPSILFIQRSQNKVSFFPEYIPPTPNHRTSLFPSLPMPAKLVDMATHTFKE